MSFESPLRSDLPKREPLRKDSASPALGRMAGSGASVQQMKAQEAASQVKKIINTAKHIGERIGWLAGQNEAIRKSLYQNVSVSKPVTFESLQKRLEQLADMTEGIPKQLKTLREQLPKEGTDTAKALTMKTQIESLEVQLAQLQEQQTKLSALLSNPTAKVIFAARQEIIAILASDRPANDKADEIDATLLALDRIKSDLAALRNEPLLSQTLQLLTGALETLKKEQEPKEPGFFSKLFGRKPSEDFTLHLGTKIDYSIKAAKKLQNDLCPPKESLKTVAELPTASQTENSKAYLRKVQSETAPNPAAFFFSGKLTTPFVHYKVSEIAKGVERTATQLLKVQSDMQRRMEEIARGVTKPGFEFTSLQEEIQAYRDAIDTLQSELDRAQEDLGKRQTSKAKAEVLGFIARWEERVKDLHEKLAFLESMDEKTYKSFVELESSVIGSLQKADDHPLQAAVHVFKAQERMKGLTPFDEGRQAKGMGAYLPQRLEDLQKFVHVQSKTLLELRPEEEKLLNAILSGEKDPKKVNQELLKSLLAKEMTRFLLFASTEPNMRLNRVLALYTLPEFASLREDKEFSAIFGLYLQKSDYSQNTQIYQRFNEAYRQDFAEAKKAIDQLVRPKGIIATVTGYARRVAATESLTLDVQKAQERMLGFQQKLQGRQPSEPLEALLVAHLASQVEDHLKRLEEFAGTHSIALAPSIALTRPPTELFAEVIQKLEAGLDPEKALSAVASAHELFRQIEKMVPPAANFAQLEQQKNDLAKQIRLSDANQKLLEKLVEREEAGDRSLDTFPKEVTKDRMVTLLQHEMLRSLYQTDQKDIVSARDNCRRILWVLESFLELRAEVLDTLKQTSRQLFFDYFATNIVKAGQIPDIQSAIETIGLFIDTNSLDHAEDELFSFVKAIKERVPEYIREFVELEMLAGEDTNFQKLHDTIKTKAKEAGLFLPISSALELSQAQAEFGKYVAQFKVVDQELKKPRLIREEQQGDTRVELFMQARKCLEQIAKINAAMPADQKIDIAPLQAELDALVQNRFMELTTHKQGIKSALIQGIVPRRDEKDAERIATVLRAEMARAIFLASRGKAEAFHNVNLIQKALKGSDLAPQVQKLLGDVVTEYEKLAVNRSRGITEASLPIDLAREGQSYEAMIDFHISRMKNEKVEAFNYHQARQFLEDLRLLKEEHPTNEALKSSYDRAEAKLLAIANDPDFMKLTEYKQRLADPDFDLDTLITIDPSSQQPMLVDAEDPRRLRLVLNKLMVKMIYGNQAEKAEVEGLFKSLMNRLNSRPLLRQAVFEGIQGSLSQSNDAKDFFGLFQNYLMYHSDLKQPMEKISATVQEALLSTDLRRLDEILSSFINTDYGRLVAAAKDWASPQLNEIKEDIRSELKAHRDAVAKRAKETVKNEHQAEWSALYENVKLMHKAPVEGLDQRLKDFALALHKFTSALAPEQAAAIEPADFGFTEELKAQIKEKLERSPWFTEQMALAKAQCQRECLAPLKTADDFFAAKERITKLVPSVATPATVQALFIFPPTESPEGLLQQLKSYLILVSGAYAYAGAGQEFDFEIPKLIGKLKELQNPPQELALLQELYDDYKVRPKNKATAKLEHESGLLLNNAHDSFKKLSAAAVGLASIVAKLPDTISAKKPLLEHIERFKVEAQNIEARMRQALSGEDQRALEAIEKMPRSSVVEETEYKNAKAAIFSRIDRAKAAVILNDAVMGAYTRDAIAILGRFNEIRQQIDSEGGRAQELMTMTQYTQTQAGAKRQTDEERMWMDYRQQYNDFYSSFTGSLPLQLRELLQNTPPEKIQERIQLLQAYKELNARASAIGQSK